MNKAVPGQRHIPAADWNELRDFMNSYTPQNGGVVNNPLNPFFVYVQNDTSDDLPAFSVVKLDGTIYPQRSTDDTKNAALNQLLEISGKTPTGELNENIGILQEDVEAGQLGRAIVVGASFVYVQVDDANETYRFAKSMDETGKMKADKTGGQARIIWKEAGTGKKAAYVVLDQKGAEPEYFVINKGWNGEGTPPNDPDVYKKGTLHYITFDGSEWVPHSSNESSSVTTLKRPVGSKLVVCQEDAPDNAKDYHMPYFTPESNMGVPPAYSSSFQFSWGKKRCGVKPGEHTFTDQMYDYNVSFNSGVNVGSSGSASASASYEYEPQFVAIVTVSSSYGGAGMVYAELNNDDHWLVSFPSEASGLSAPCFPDIYPDDEIVVEIDCERQLCLALDYSRDYRSGTVMAFYGSAPGRGWEQYSTPASLSSLGFYLYLKVKTDALL